MRQLPVWIAFTFGIIFLSALLALAIWIPNPTNKQFEIFRIVIAAAMAGVFAIIPGSLNVRLRYGSGILVTAGGAIAVFVIVYFFSPAHWLLGAESNNKNQPSTFSGTNNGNYTAGNNSGNMTINPR